MSYYLKTVEPENAEGQLKRTYDMLQEIDDKTKQILHFSEKVTRHANRVTESDIRALQDIGCTEEEVFEAVAVTSLFNYMDRMADALGAPVENFQEMVASMMLGTGNRIFSFGQNP